MFNPGYYRLSGRLIVTTFCFLFYFDHRNLTFSDSLLEKQGSCSIFTVTFRMGEWLIFMHSVRKVYKWKESWIFHPDTSSSHLNRPPVPHTLACPCLYACMLYVSFPLKSGVIVGTHCCATVTSDRKSLKMIKVRTMTSNHHHISDQQFRHESGWVRRK